eukprot:3043184-Pleurochrysis_carterae.AAC.1
MDGEASSKQPLEGGSCLGSSPSIFEAGPCAASSFLAAPVAAGCPGANSTAFFNSTTGTLCSDKKPNQYVAAFRSRQLARTS